VAERETEKVREKSPETAADTSIHEVHPTAVDPGSGLASSNYKPTERRNAGDTSGISTGLNVQMDDQITAANFEISGPDVSSRRPTSPSPLSTTRYTIPTADQRHKKKTKSTETKETYAIYLGSGVRLEYYESDFCEPPSLNGLVSTPARFLEAWDQNSSTGNCTSPLIIRGVPVPVKYWRTYYGNFRKKKWGLMKQSWLSYKVRLKSTSNHPRTCSD